MTPPRLSHQQQHGLAAAVVLHGHLLQRRRKGPGRRGGAFAGIQERHRAAAFAEFHLMGVAVALPKESHLQAMACGVWRAAYFDGIHIAFRASSDQLVVVAKVRYRTTRPEAEPRIKASISARLA